MSETHDFGLSAIRIAIWNKDATKREQNLADAQLVELLAQIADLSKRLAEQQAEAAKWKQKYESTVKFWPKTSPRDVDE